MATATGRETGFCIIREPGVMCRCTPLCTGGWRVESTRGTTEHPAVGDPWLACARHIAAT